MAWNRGHSSQLLSLRNNWSNEECGFLCFLIFGATCRLIPVLVSLRSNVGVEIMENFDAISVSQCNSKFSLCLMSGSQY